MANAKQCDECGDLYLQKNSPNVVHPKHGGVRAIQLLFIVGKDSLDLCPACKQMYANDILKFYTEIQHGI